jgi:hypothetical protein
MRDTARESATVVQYHKPCTHFTSRESFQQPMAWHTPTARKQGAQRRCSSAQAHTASANNDHC